MSIYRIQLDAYEADFFQLPVICGNEAFLLDFSWDTIAQEHKDNIDTYIRQLGETNPLIKLSDLKTHVPNTDFPSYILTLNETQKAYDVFSAKLQNTLMYGSGDYWSSFLLDIDSQIESFSDSYISINHFSKLQNFLAYLGELRMLVNVATPDKDLVLAKLQDPASALFAYIDDYVDICEEARVELLELAELLFWSITVHHNDQSYTCALEIGAVQFYQNPLFHFMFDSPRPTIGRRDLSLVTVWVGIKDGIA